MSSIDKRIVQMQFDNHNFESGVSKTMNSLKNLNNSLKMEGSTNGLDKVSNGIKNLSSSGLSGLAQNVENISSKFSALGVVGVTALANITNSAVNAGKNLVKSLTIEPITTGFSEYETKMGSIQTILTNTAHQGTTLEDVTKALNDLNTYSDQTIYNFAEMTRNIGTFTAAGVDLDTSTAAIKGIANLAAASGSSSQQASTAMYQLSQALAAGKVSLQDWNSVVNAGMGGKLFQDALIRTSEHLGTNAEDMIKKYGSFRESLTKGEWMTSEVLTETLKQLSGAYTEADLIAQGYTESQAKEIVKLAKNATAAATEVKTVTQLVDTMKESVQSGWAQSWEYIIGDKDQATKTLTAISEAFSNLIGPSTKARNDMLKFWNEAGGRDDVISGISNIVGSIGKALSAVGDAWKEIFPPMTGKKLVELSEGFKNLTEKFKMSDETAGKIKNTFKGLFSIFNIVKNAVVAVLSSLTPLGSIFTNLGGIVLSVTSGIGSFVSKLNEAANKSNIFGKISNGIKSAFTGIGNFISNISNVIDSLFSALSKLDFSSVFGSIGSALSGIGSGLSPILNGIGKALGSINFNTIFQVINTALAAGIFKTIKGTIENVGEVVEDTVSIFDSIKGAAEGITGTLDAVRESLEAYTTSLKVGTLLKISVAIGILAAALVALSTIDGDKLDEALSGITVLFIELIAAMSVLLKVATGTNLKGFFTLGTAMITMSTAILILSGAMKVLSGLDWEGVAKGLVSIAGLMVTLVAASKLMSGSSKGLISTATGLLILSVAINNLSKAVEKLGELEVETLTKGLISIATLLAELAIFAKLTQASKMGVTSSVGLLVLAGALNLFAVAVKSFGSMDTNALIQGLAGVGTVLLELAAFMKLTGNSLGILATAAGLTVLAVALNIMSVAVKSFGSMQWETIGKGLTAMAGGLAIVAAAVALIPGVKLLSTAVGLTAMSGALLILGAALNSLGGQSWEEVAISLVSLAGALTILAVAMAAMSTGLAGAAAMLVMSAALAVFVPQLMLLASLDLSQVGIALLALAGAFTVLGIAGLVLTPVVPTLVALAGAIALLGVATLAVGAGLTAFGTGLSLVAAAGAGAGLALAEIIRQLLDLLPQLGTKFGEAIVNMAQAISNGIPTIITAFGQLISGIISAVAKCIPQIVTAAVQLVTEFAKALGTAIPTLVDVGVQMVVNILNGISKNIGKLVSAAADLIVKFLEGVSSNLGRVIQAGIDLAINFVNGVADGISSNSGRMASAVGNLVSAIVTAGLGLLGSAVGSFVTAGANLIGGFITGIGRKVGAAAQAVSNVVSSAVRAAGNCGSKLVSAGRDLIAGFISGIKEKAGAARERIASIASDLASRAKEALDIHSPSRVFMEIGRYTVEGLAVGLSKYAKRINAPADNLANKVIQSASKPLSALSSLLSDDIDMAPVITPVMDLSDVKSGAKTLNGLLSNGSMTIAGSAGVISRSIGKVQNGTDNSDVISALKDLKDSLSNNNGNTTYSINGITYDDGSNVTSAVETLVRAAKIERRI